MVVRALAETPRAMVSPRRGGMGGVSEDCATPEINGYGFCLYSLSAETFVLRFCEYLTGSIVARAWRGGPRSSTPPREKLKYKEKRNIITHQTHSPLF